MALNLNVEWLKPLPLRDGSNDNLIYTTDASISNASGVYVFCRRWGGQTIPIYIGQAQTFSSRIEQQFNTTKLMVGVQNQPQGKRYIYLARLHPKPGQQLKKSLDLLERTLIRFALAEGYELLNDQGTKTPVHTRAIALSVSQGKHDLEP